MTNALMEYQPAILNQAINQKYNQLGSMVNTGYNASNTVMNTSQNTLSNIANMGMSAAGGTPIGQPGSSPSANYLQQQGVADASYNLQRNNNMVNTLNTGVDNYFKYRNMNPNNNNNNNNNAPIQPSYDYSNYGGDDVSQPGYNDQNYGPSPYAEQRKDF